MKDIEDRQSVSGESVWSIDSEQAARSSDGALIDGLNSAGMEPVAEGLQGAERLLEGGDLGQDPETPEDMLGATSSRVAIGYHKIDSADVKRASVTALGSSVCLLIGLAIQLLVEEHSGWANSVFSSGSLSPDFIVGSSQPAISLVALSLGGYSIVSLLLALWGDLQRGGEPLSLDALFTPPGAFIAALSAALVFNLVAVFADPVSFSQALIYDSLLVIAASISLSRYLLFKFYVVLKRMVGFTLADRLSPVRVIDKKGRGASSGELRDDDKRAEAVFEVPLHKVVPGQFFKVSSGQVIPLDSLITAGAGEVSERVYSGFSTQVMKDRGQEVTAGSVLLKGNLECQVRRPIWRARIASFAERFERLVDDSVAPREFEAVFVKRSLQLVWLAAFLGSLSFIARGGELFQIGQIFVGVMLLIPLPLTLVLLRLVRGVTVTGLFKAGILLQSPAVLNRTARLRSLVVNQTLPVDEEEWEFRAIDILDERYDPDSLRSVLISLLRYSDDELHKLIYQTLRPQTERLVVYAIEGLEYDEEHAVKGRLEGSPLAFGREEFLIQNTVYLQASDVQRVSDEETSFFFGVGRDVVARLRMVRKPHYRALGSANLLKKLYQVRLLLWSSGSVEELDQIGREVGLEPAQVQGGLLVEEMCSRLSSMESTALYSDYSGEGCEGAALSIALFSAARRELPPVDIVLFDRDPKVLLSLFGITKSSLALERFLIGFSIMATAGVFTALLFDIAGIWLAAVSMLAVPLVSFLVLKRAARRHSLW